MTRNDKIETLQRVIRYARNSAHEAARGISKARKARDPAGCRESESKLREIVERAHDARREIEAIAPGNLEEVQADLDYLYAKALRWDPSALDRLEERDAARKVEELTREIRDSRKIPASKVEELAHDIHYARAELESDGFSTLQRLYVRVMSGHVVAAELSRLAGPIGSAHARYRLNDVRKDLDYLYDTWKDATGEDFTPAAWDRLGILGLRATARRIKNEIKNKS